MANRSRAATRRPARRSGLIPTLIAVAGVLATALALYLLVIMPALGSEPAEAEVEGTQIAAPLDTTGDFESPTVAILSETPPAPAAIPTGPGSSATATPRVVNIGQVEVISTATAPPNIAGLPNPSATPTSRATSTTRPTTVSGRTPTPRPTPTRVGSGMVVTDPPQAPPNQSVPGLPVKPQRPPSGQIEATATRTATAVVQRSNTPTTEPIEVLPTVAPTARPTIGSGQLATRAPATAESTATPNDPTPTTRPRPTNEPSPSETATPTREPTARATATREPEPTETREPARTATATSPAVPTATPVRSRPTAQPTATSIPQATTAPPSQPTTPPTAEPIRPTAEVPSQPTVAPPTSPAPQEPESTRPPRG